MVGVYLNPPANAVVLSFDEKSQIQALPSLPTSRETYLDRSSSHNSRVLIPDTKDVVAKPTWNPFLLATGIASLAACGEPGERSAGPTTEWVAVADFVVESGQDDLASVPVRPLGAAEVVIGGWRQDSLPIPDVRDAILIPNGTVWVAGSTTRQVLTFSADGRPL